MKRSTNEKAAIILAVSVILSVTACVISDITDTGFTATVPYLDLYEAHRSAKIEYLLDNGTYKINSWTLNLEAI